MSCRPAQRSTPAAPPSGSTSGGVLAPEPLPRAAWGPRLGMASPAFLTALFAGRDDAARSLGMSGHRHTGTGPPAPAHRHRHTGTGTPAPAHRHRHTGTGTPAPAPRHRRDARPDRAIRRRPVLGL